MERKFYIYESSDMSKKAETFECDNMKRAVEWYAQCPVMFSHGYGYTKSNPAYFTSTDGFYRTFVVYQIPEWEEAI